jgi:hypothetical protein
VQSAPGQTSGETVVWSRSRNNGADTVQHTLCTKPRDPTTGTRCVLR